MQGFLFCLLCFRLFLSYSRLFQVISYFSFISLIFKKFFVFLFPLTSACHVMFMNHYVTSSLIFLRHVVSVDFMFFTNFIASSSLSLSYFEFIFMALLFYKHASACPRQLFSFVSWAYVPGRFSLVCGPMVFFQASCFF